MNYCKKHTYQSAVLVIDGLFGTGKLAAAELTGALSQSEHWLHDYPLEYFSILAGVGKLGSDAAEAAILARVDELIYNISIGRSINLRTSDLTSILRGRDRISRLSRLIKKPQNDSFFAEEGSSKIILPLVLHSSTFNNYIFESSLGNRLCLTYLLRHPAECLEHYASYIDRIGEDPREFTMHFQHVDKFIPWWIPSECAELYSTSSLIERAIICIYAKLKLLKHKMDSNHDAHYFVTFERLTSNPAAYIEALQHKIGFGDIDKKFYSKVLRRNQLPRTTTILQNGFWKNYSRGKDAVTIDDGGLLRCQDGEEIKKEVLKMYDAAVDMYSDMSLRC